MVFSSDKVNEALRLIEGAQNIVITTHVGPDGDAIGSSLGLYHFLKGMGKQVTVITPNHFPDFLKWMKDSDQIIPYTEQTENATAITQACDLMFCLDFNDLSRTDRYAEVAALSVAPKIMVDHHEQPKDFAQLMFSDAAYSSTCEMIFDFIMATGKDELITPELASCLYTGLVTDTGSFRHSCTAPSTHKAAAILMERGANNSKIAQLINDTNSFDRLRLIGYALSEKMVYLPEYKTIFFTLELDELKRFNYRDGDTEGLVNYGLSVADVNMSAFFRQSEDKIKISFRSKGNFSVQEFSKAHFNGGGHHNASGGASYLSMPETISKFLSVLPEFKEKLNAE